MASEKKNILKISLTCMFTSVAIKKREKDRVECYQFISPRDD